MQVQVLLEMRAVFGPPRNYQPPTGSMGKDGRRLVVLHIVSFEVLDDEGVKPVPGQPDVDLPIRRIDYGAVVARAVHQAVHVVAEVLTDVADRPVSIDRSDAVAGPGAILSIGLVSSCQAIPHVGLQSVHLPVGREAVFQHAVGMQLGGSVVP